MRGAFPAPSPPPSRSAGTFPPPAELRVGKTQPPILHGEREEGVGLGRAGWILQASDRYPSPPPRPSSRLGQWKPERKKKLNLNAAPEQRPLGFVSRRGNAPGWGREQGLSWARPAAPEPDCKASPLPKKEGSPPLLRPEPGFLPSPPHLPRSGICEPSGRRRGDLAKPAQSAASLRARRTGIWQGLASPRRQPSSSPPSESGPGPSPSSELPQLSP